MYFSSSVSLEISVLFIRLSPSTSTSNRRSIYISQKSVPYCHYLIFWFPHCASLQRTAIAVITVRSREFLVFLADVSVHCWLMLGLWSVKTPNDILKERLLLFPPLSYKREGLWKTTERLKKEKKKSIINMFIIHSTFSSISLCLNFFKTKFWLYISCHYVFFTILLHNEAM